MDGYKTLNTGDKVSFEIVDGTKGKQAANVSVTEAAPVTTEASESRQ